MARLDTTDVGHWLNAAKLVSYSSRDLSQKLNISDRQLRRYTRQLFAQSPQQWLNAERLARAAGLLKKCRCVKRVALELGFKRLSHFSREFRHYYGLSPTDFLVWSDRSGGGLIVHLETTKHP